MAQAAEAGARGVSELEPRRLPFWLDVLRRLYKEKPLGFWGGFVIIIALSIVAILAPVISPHDPNYQDATALLEGPSLEHPFGTDQIGRDVFSRVAYGARLSLGVGAAAVAIGIGAATIIGLISGYFGGWVDSVIQRVVDIFMAFPGFILILLMVAIWGAGTDNVIYALAIFLAAAPSRVVRSSVLTLREQPFIEAGKVIGCTDLRVMTRYVFPNIVPIVIVMVSINIGFAIITEAGLSFLGLGIPPPNPSWGNMITGASRSFFRENPWMVVFPGAALALTVFAFNMLGDALRDILDPRLRTI
jgi:peptide/nickel transport system permease protein